MTNVNNTEANNRDKQGIQHPTTLDIVADVRHVTKKIRDKTIINDVSFQIRAGEIVGFLGPNGAGKTMTMRMMTGLISITEGDVLIGGLSIKTEREQALRKIGGMIESPEMYTFMSGYDNLKYLQRMYGPVDHERIHTVTRLVGLEDAIRRKVRTYSLGMKQRLGIAQALLHSPKLLILDEPTNGLDPTGIREMRDHLRKLAKEENIAIFISSHLLSEVELLCERVIFIQNGSIIGTEEVRHDDWQERSVTLVYRMDESAEATAFLQKRGYVAELSEGLVRVQLPYPQIPEVHEALISNQYKFYTAELIRETLEDRFLKQTATGGGR